MIYYVAQGELFMISKDVFQYFIDLENSKCQKKDSFILINNTDFTNIIDCGRILTAKINETPFYLKKHTTSTTPLTIQCIAASKLLNASNITSPPIFLATDDNFIYETTQNIGSLPLNHKIASEAYGISGSAKPKSNNKFANYIGHS